MLATVTGRGRFPLDMLRYDSCFPASESDAYKIEATYEEYSKWSIRIAKPTRNLVVVGGKDDFTIARWESFGCKIEIDAD